MRRLLIVFTLAGALSAPAVSARAQTSSDDKKFLEKDSQGNVAEVELAKLALQKSSNPDVKAFALRMVKDHETLARNMQPLIDRAGLHPSGSLDGEHQHLYDRLKALSGDGFDKEYVKAMDKDHHDDLNAFRKEIATTQDQRIKGIVQAGAAVIAEHTRMIDDISAKMGMMPAGT